MSHRKSEEVDIQAIQVFQKFTEEKRRGKQTEGEKYNQGPGRGTQGDT